MKKFLSKVAPRKVALYFWDFLAPLVKSDSFFIKVRYFIVLSRFPNLKNPKLFMQLSIGFNDAPETIKEHSGMAFSYAFVEEIDKNYIDLIKSFKDLKFKVKASNKKLSWSALTKSYPVVYEIFFFEAGEISDAELNNLMFVEYAKRTKHEKLALTASVTNSTSYKLKNRGKFSAVIVAEIKGPAPIKYIYPYTNVSGGSTFADLWWIILIVVLAVAAIAAGVVYFIMHKKNKDVVLPTNYDPLMGSINQ